MSPGPGVLCVSSTSSNILFFEGDALAAHLHYFVDTRYTNPVHSIPTPHSFMCSIISSNSCHSSGTYGSAISTKTTRDRDCARFGHAVDRPLIKDTSDILVRPLFGRGVQRMSFSSQLDLDPVHP